VNLRKTIGTNVAAMRKSRELNQAQLASMLNVNKQTIYRIEAGSTNVGVDTIAALAKALGVEPAMLLVGGSGKGSGNRGERRLEQLIDYLRRALRYAETYKSTYRN